LMVGELHHPPFGLRVVRQILLECFSK
jgi:hypothetical protein